MDSGHIERWVRREGRRLNPILAPLGFAPVWASHEDGPQLWTSCETCGDAVRLTRKPPEPDYLLAHWARHHRFKAHVVRPLVLAYNARRRRPTGDAKPVHSDDLIARLTRKDQT